MVSELRRQYFPGFSPRAASSLLRHDWPGNVRELKNAIERSIYRSTDVDQKVTRIAFDPFDSPFRLREKKKPDKGKTSPQVTQDTRAPRLPINLKSHIDDTERKLLNAALEQARFNQRMAASLLGLTYHQFRGKIRKHELDRAAVPEG
jgi:psp operon transcriptional activator